MKKAKGVECMVPEKTRLLAASTQQSTEIRYKVAHLNFSCYEPVLPPIHEIKTKIKSFFLKMLSKCKLFP